MTIKKNRSVKIVAVLCAAVLAVAGLFGCSSDASTIIPDVKPV